jgi:dTDP-glucose 4,6-dehydratase
MFMRRIVVTGGCGFIGSNYIRYVLETDPEAVVVNLDKLTYASNPDNLADLANHARCSFVRADIAEAEAVNRVLADGAAVVINFAAETHVDRSIQDAAPFIHTNILGTQVLLDAVCRHRIPRYLQVSTDEVYGSLGPAGSFTEESPLAPSSPYAASKAAADLLVRSHVHTYGVSAVITRCSNNYGPYQFPEKLLPLFISNLLHDEPVPVYGDGLQVRDWIHVRDHCAALDLIWRRGRSGEIYNIGGGCERTNLEMTHLLLEILGKSRSLIRFVADRPGHDRRYALSHEKLTRELGWRPTVSLESGLRETVRWYQEHAAWVQRIRNGAYREYFERQYGYALSASRAP